MPSGKAIAAVGVGALPLILAIAAVAAPEMYVGKGRGAGQHVGVFEMKAGGTTSKVKCGDSTGCAKDQCGAMQAFSILGILANSGGLAVISALAFKLGELPIVAAAGAYGFAALSYMIVWALVAAAANRKPDDPCGGSDGYADLGASFGLMIVAWLLCVVASLGALFMAGKGDGSNVFD